MLDCAIFTYVTLAYSIHNSQSRSKIQIYKSALFHYVLLPEKPQNVDLIKDYYR